MNRNRKDPVERGGSVPRYSRAEGVGAYRRRRRASKIARGLVAVVLLAILGGTAYLFGRQYITLELPTLSHQDKSDNAKIDDDVETSVEPMDISLVAVGDITMNSLQVVQSGLTESGSYSYDHLFNNIKNDLTTADVRIVGQETALAGDEFGFGNAYQLNAPQELGRAEVSVGFNVVLRACDHTLDWGAEGLHNELFWWHDKNPYIGVLGVAEPDPTSNPGLSDYVNNVYVFEKNGFKIAILNHTSAYNISEDAQSYVSVMTEEKIAQDVAAAKEAGADVIVACPHWGREGVAELSEEQTTYAKVYADAGVDLILGMHPRVLQHVEIIEGEGGHRTVCYYSLGCYVSGLTGDSLIGGMANVTLHRDEQGNCSVTSAVLRTVVTHRAEGKDYTVYPVSAYTDELAATSLDAYTLTPEQIGLRCTELLGEEYDVETAELRLKL